MSQLYKNTTILHTDPIRNKTFIDLINNVTKHGGNCTIDVKEMNSTERAIIHEHCEKLGLFTMSKKINLGKNIIVSKDKFSVTITNDHVIFFVKQMHLPISYCTVDTIEYYLTVLDPYFDNCSKKYKMFIAELFNGFDASHFLIKISRKAIDYIKSHSEYQTLINSTLNLKLGSRKKMELYQTSHVGKRFVSLDVIKGNFTVLKLRCPGIFKGSWEDFISQFTESQFIRTTKRIREVIFGDLKFSKLANSLQEHEINELYEYLLGLKDVIDKMTLISKVGDEMIFELNDDLKNESLTNVMSAYSKQIFHVRIFTLRQFEGVPYFYKEYLDGTIEPRKVQKKYMMQVIKHYENKPIEELDLTSMDDDGFPYVYKKSIFD